MSYLASDLAVVRGDFTVRVPVVAEAGEVVALLGPNGAGKSTVLQLIAGLLAADDGSLELAGRRLSGPDTAPLPVSRRRISLMSQDPLLFPHLTAVENVAFGPRAQGTDRAGARVAARHWLDQMGLSAFADRRPAELSGGQRQRVAIARALAAAPDLLMLDEPLGALDVETAPEIRQLLRSRIRESGITTLLVTHDVLDAAVLADRVLVLDRGTVVDQGATGVVLAAPRSAFSARLAGLNLATGRVVEVAGGTSTLETADGRRISGLTDGGLSAGADAAAVFRPSAVALFATEVAGSPRNHWAAQITGLEPAADGIRVRTSVDVAADITPAAVADLSLVPGSQVFLSVKATEVRLYRR